jgi:hypothetical protein
VGGLKSQERLAHTRVGQHAMSVDVPHPQLRRPAVLARAPCGPPAPDRRPALAQGQGEPRDTGGLPLPATGSPDGLERCKRTASHPGCASAQALPTVRLDDLGGEPPRQRQPARLGPRALGLAAFWGPPPAKGPAEGRESSLAALTPPRGPTT